MLVSLHQSISGHSAMATRPAPKASSHKEIASEKVSSQSHIDSDITKILKNLTFLTLLQQPRNNGDSRTYEPTSKERS